MTARQPAAASKSKSAGASDSPELTSPTIGLVTLGRDRFPPNDGSRLNRSYRPDDLGFPFGRIGFFSRIREVELPHLV